MEKIKLLLALITFVIAFATCTENDPGVVTPEDEKPEPTMVGIPIGIPVTKTIGPDGGTIQIAGEVEVAIPAGALSSNTEISILPVTNNAPNGNGNAYRFGPDGTKFDKPVKVTFPFLNNDPTMPPLTGIAYQDTDGFWHSAGKFTWDETNGTVSTEALHFSDWATFNELKILDVGYVKYIGNGVYQMKVKEVGKFELAAITSTIPGANDAELSPLSSDAGLAHMIIYKKNSKMGVVVKEWSVNGDVNGKTGKFGTIDVSGQDSLCTYTAPTKKPVSSGNPVQLSVRLRNLKYKDPKSGQVFNNLTVSTQIEIVDESKYDFTITYYSKDLLTGGLVGKGFLDKDSATFRILLKDDNITCSDFINVPGKIIPTSQTDVIGCKSTVTTEEEAYVGALNITSCTGVYTSTGSVRNLQLTLVGTGQTPSFSLVCPLGGDQSFPAASGILFLPIAFKNVNDSIPVFYNDPSGSIKAKLTPVE